MRATAVEFAVLPEVADLFQLGELRAKVTRLEALVRPRRHWFQWWRPPKEPQVRI